VNGDVHPDNADRTALEAVTRGCLAGTGVCFVSHKGDVFPCGYMPLKAGNVGEKRLREIWAQAPLFANLRNTSLLKGRCGRCGYAQICSGCRARALAVSGDAFDEDPGCGYVPPALRRSGMEQDA
jgi:radical SAM protein with 4Fe4S-binding SPASM domain